MKVHGDAVLSVKPVETAKSCQYFIIKQLMEDLPKVVIKVFTILMDNFFNLILTKSAVIVELSKIVDANLYYYSK